MRKNDLIQLLQNIKGNPDIVLWNGYVGDYMHIDGIVKSDLVKIEQKHWLELCRLQDCRDKSNWDYQMSVEEVERLKIRYKTMPYEIDEYVTTEDIKAKKYKRKSVVFIQPKKRGISTFDRIGEIEY